MAIFKKIQKSRGIQDLLVSLFSRGGNMLIGLAMQSLLAWKLGPDGRGEYAICLIFTTITAAFFTFGMDWAASYFIASKKKPFNRVVSLSYIFILTVPLIMWPVLSAVTHMPLKFFAQASPSAFNISIFWCFSTISYFILSSILRGLRAFSLLALISISKILHALIVTYFLTSNEYLDIFAKMWSGYVGHRLVIHDLGVLAPIWADLTGNVLIFISITVLLIFKWQWRFRFPGLDTVTAMFSYGSRMFGGAIGMVSNLRIGTVLIAFYVTKNEIGYFALAMSLLTQLGTLSDAINNILMPRISSSTDGRQNLVALSAKWVSTLVLVIGIVILLTAHWFVPLLFSKQFIPAIELLWILFPGMWLRSVCKVLFAYFNGVNKPQIVTYNTIINILLNVILLYYCLPRWGLLGAAWITTIVNILSTLHIVFFYRTNTSMHMLNFFFITKKDVLVLLKRLN